jgi:hypothetical protein
MPMRKRRAVPEVHADQGYDQRFEIKLHMEKRQGGSVRRNNSDKHVYGTG